MAWPPIRSTARVGGSQAMPTRTAMSRLAARRCVALLVLGALGDTRPGTAIRAPDYDECCARGDQLVKDGSFEQMDRTGTKLAHWGVYRTVEGCFRVMADAAGSSHGTQYVEFRPDKQRTVYGSLTGTPAGQFRAAVRVRGSGRFRFALDPRPRGWRSRKTKTLGRQHSEWHKIESTNWELCAWDFGLPAEYTVDGKREKPEGIGFRFLVEGELSFDQCLVAKRTLWTDAPASSRRTPASPEPKGSVPPPFLTLPRLGRAPIIDGVIGEKEWQQAAAVTGFTELNTRRCASRQTVVYAGYDARCLYVAFRCPHEGKLGEGEPVRDAGFGHGIDAVEIWLVPPDGNPRQFVAWPGGGRIDKNGTDGLAWNPEWEVRHRVRDSGETIGGILTFRRKLWTAEAAIPFAELGVSPPADGEQWRANFTRDFSVAKGRTKSVADWTTWSPIAGRFGELEQFGAIRFSAAVPAIQWLTLGDLANGELAAAGRISGTGPAVRLQCRTTFADTPGKTLSFRSATVEPSPDAAQPFDLRDKLRVAGSTDGVMHFQAEQGEDAEPLTRAALPFRAAPALRVKLIPVPTRGTLYAQVNSARLADALPETFTAHAVVCAGDTPTDTAVGETWSNADLRRDLRLDTSALPPGDYQLRVSLRREPGGEAIAAAVERFVLPPKPEWLGNDIGLTEDVPPPWTPVGVDGTLVEITERRYRIGPQGLPEQVTVLGEDLFAAAPGISLTVNDRPLAWTAEAPELVERRERLARWRIGGTAGPVRLEGQLTVEFDGFALLDFTLGTSEALTVDRVALDFPFAEDRAMYVRAPNAHGEHGTCFALLDHDGEPKQAGICAVHYGLGKWFWPDAWFHEIWVGDDSRGFSVMCETEEPLRGRQRTCIEKTADATTLSIVLIDGPHRLDAPLRFRYMWQATPVKPLVRDPKTWHVCYRGQTTEGAASRLFATLDYWALKWQCYPELFLPRRAWERRNKPLLDSECKLVPYFGTSIVTTEAPDLKPFLREWEHDPVMISSSPRGGWITACHNSTYADRCLHSLKGIVDDIGFNGLYLDVSSCSACKNPYHGCGYRDPETGERRPVVNILAARRLCMRMYQFLRSEGREGVLFRHGMPVPAVAGFVDVVTQGEDWCREGKAQYDRLTPEIFRVKEMKRQYGVPHTWYTFHHYYRGVPFGGRVPLAAILAYCLPHHILPTEGRQGMWPVWEATDQFWTTSEFIPYWATTPAAAAPDPGVLCSAYVQRDTNTAWLVVANWSTEAITTNVALDLRRMGLSPERVSAGRALKHPILQPEDPPEGDTMPNTPIALSAGKLRLALAPRNLELVRLRSK